MEVYDIRNLKGFAYGLIFGFASPIPGVSAGSIAVFLNVYDKFFNTISVATVKKNWLYTICFLLGWAVGLFGVSNIIIYLLENHRMIISFCFIGLILGCVPLIYKKATRDKVKPVNISFFVIALAFMVFLAFQSGDLSSGRTIEQLGDITPAVLAWIFLLSFISSAAMLIPGIGGSLMMFVLGIYTIYVESVSSLNLILLATFVVSMILGVLAGIALTKKILEAFPQALYFAVLGFVIGSLLIIFPGFSINMEGLLAIVSLAVFTVFGYWLAKKE